MSMIISRIVLSSMLSLVSLTCVGGPAFAQSDVDIQDENRELRTRVRDLERELDAAQRQIDTLERRLARLQNQTPVDPGSPEPEEVPLVTIDETIPSASPRALLAALRDDYVATLGDKEMGSSPRDKERVAYMRAVRAWEARVNREFKSPITWHVKLRGLEHLRGRSQTGYIVTADAVDPVSGTILGEPFSFAISLQQARTFETLLKDVDDELGRLDPMVLKAVLTPRVTIDPNRADEGAFGGVDFIAPYALFAFELDAKSLRPVPEIAEETGATKPAKDSG